MQSETIITEFSKLGLDITSAHAHELSKRRNIEEAFEYYFENPSKFQQTLPPPPPPAFPSVQTHAVAPPPPKPKIQFPKEYAHLNKNEVALSLNELGFPVADIAAALLRNNTLDGALRYLLGTGDIPQPTFSCVLCMSDGFSADEMVTLSCVPAAHRFCKDCFSGYCMSKINDAEVEESQLSCPALVDGTVCKTPITCFEIQANVEPEVYAKYEWFTLRHVCETQKLRSCPKCNEWYIDLSQILNDRDERWASIKCDKCKHRFCGRCGETPHKRQKEQNITCEEFAKWKQENDVSEKQFRELMQQQRIFPCPKCGMAGERGSGCKFLYCHCKAMFCALCGVLLNQSKHYSHFQGGPGCTGPFGEVCRGVEDGIKG